MFMVLSLVLFVASLIYLRRVTGLYALFAISFLLFGFILRMASATYIEFFGPVYALHFGRYIQSYGIAGLVFTLSLIVVLAATALFLQPKAIFPKNYPVIRYRIDQIANAAIVSFSLYVFAMYGDMLIRGVIPLFTFMERDTYTNNYAGIFHKVFFQFNFLFAFLLGFFFVRPRLQGGAFDLRYLAILMALYFYFVLTGHRFSIFFAVTAFFLIPVSAVWLQARAGRLPRSRDPEQVRRILAVARMAAPFIVLLLLALTSYALYNSLFNVRSYSDPVQAFVQRSLVQPTELWWVTWESSIRNGELNQARAFHQMFVDPIDGTRNTGIQFLMAKELGHARAASLLFYGEQYAGGYPEVLFELLGPYWAWPAMFVFAGVTLNFLRIAFIAVLNQRLGTAIFSIFLFYGFSVLYIGGMLNFLQAPTLYVKIALLIGFMLYERPPTRRPAVTMTRAPTI